MSEHTPGPWAVRGPREVISKDESKPWPPVVADTRGLHGEADARLIAAAPDLLAVVEAALPMMRQWPDTFAAVIAQAEAATRKARGEP